MSGALAGFLFFCALLVLAIVMVGGVTLWRAGARADLLMAVQLLGTGGIAVLLLLSAAEGMPALVDMALTLGVLSAFVAAALHAGLANRSRKGERS